MAEMYPQIKAGQQHWNRKIKPLLGIQIRDSWNELWILSGVNDLGVPYFSKPNRKRQYVVSGLGQKWLRFALTLSTKHFSFSS